MSLVTGNEQRQTGAAGACVTGIGAFVVGVQDPEKRRVPIALLSVPLAGAGWLTAHSVADKLAEPHSQ